HCGRTGRLRHPQLARRVRRVPRVPPGQALVLLRNAQREAAHDTRRRDHALPSARHRGVRAEDAGRRGAGDEGEPLGAPRSRRPTDGNGADVCIEAVGKPEVLEQAFYARDLAGTVVQVGVPTPDMALPDIPMIDFFGRGGALKPSWYGDCLPSRDFPLLVDLYLQGRLDLDRFVSETITLDDVEGAFDRMQKGEVLRSVVLFD